MSNVLKFADRNVQIVIDQAGFSLNARRIAWNEISRCTEVSVPLTDLGSTTYLSVQLLSETLKISNSGLGYLALRHVMKEVLADKVQLYGPRHKKFGPEECEFTLSMARFFSEIGLVESSRFSYTKAIEQIEYYHSPKHKILVEPLRALSSMLKASDPDESSKLAARALSLESGSKEDKGFFGGLASARKNKDKLRQALDDFRKEKGREPRPAEKARILDQIQYED